MSKEKKVAEILREAGYQPLEDRAIIVNYASENLSDRIIRFFFDNAFFVLQICEESIVLLPFDELFLTLKKKVALEIPIAQIQEVRISEDMLNYRIELDTQEGKIMLSAQQKELSEYRTSGTLATGMNGLMGLFGTKYLESQNWHRKNLNATLQALKELPDQCRGV